MRDTRPIRDSGMVVDDADHHYPNPNHHHHHHHKNSQQQHRRTSSPRHSPPHLLSQDSPSLPKRGRNMPVSLLNVRNWSFDLDVVARRFAQLTAREDMLMTGLIGPSEVPRKRGQNRPTQTQHFITQPGWNKPLTEERGGQNRGRAHWERLT